MVVLGGVVKVGEGIGMRVKVIVESRVGMW